MLSVSLANRRKGRRQGGPFCLLAVLLAACSGAGARATVPASPAAGADPLELYRQRGLLAGSAAFPAVAAFVMLAAPADSTLVLVGMSLPANALRFHREGGGFAAEYRVAVELNAVDSAAGIDRSWTERVRVSSFAETIRTDESIVFQRPFLVAPGRYVALLSVTDANSARGFRATDTLLVRSFTAHEPAVSAPVLAHVAAGRKSLADFPELILNARHTIAYGGDAPVIYLEAYGSADTTAVALRVRDAADSIVWRTTVAIVPSTDVVPHAVVTIPPADLPLGVLSLEADDGRVPPERAPLLVTVSEQWVAANFDEVLQFIAYIATSEELDSLRSADAAARRVQWERFWQRRDPYPTTPANEFRDEFFARLRTSTLQFSEPGGRPGWQSARGEVYIVLGPPDQVLERYSMQTDRVAQPDGLEWVYGSAGPTRLTLLFVDRSGFGRFELEPASLAAFRRAAERIKQQR